MTQIQTLMMVILLTVMAGRAHATAKCAITPGAVLALDGVSTTISLTAQELLTGSFAAPDGQTYGPVPPTCRVVAIISSTGIPSQSAITIEVWLPERDWNGRLIGIGNGGFAGDIYWNELQLAAASGFAAAHTDLGTAVHGCVGDHCGDASGKGGPRGGLYNDPDAIIDFGGRATHLMTLAAKQLVLGFYGQFSDRNYFNGCSTGGQQALREAQNYPEDYDGIIAGAPGHNRTHVHLTATQTYAVTHATPNSYLTDAGLTLAHQAMGACLGKDGGTVHDRYLSQPAMCRVTAASLQCRGDAGEVPCTNNKSASCSCLHPDAALALDTIYGGFKDDNGDVYHPGLSRGSEEAVALTAANSYFGDQGLVYQQTPPEPAYDSLMYWASGPSFDWRSLFAAKSGNSILSAAIAAIDAAPVGTTSFSAALNAQSVDLSAFAARGGKLIMFQGWADPLVPPGGTVNYVNAVNAADPNAASYLRLYMVPGLKHCTGGPGPNAFGNVYGSQLPPLPLDPSDDLLAALIVWREQGKAPGAIIGTKYINDDHTQGVDHQRPLCPYPQHYQYTGGDWTLATNFVCVPGAPVTELSVTGPYKP